MKIAIDISSIVYGTGVSVYTRNLVSSLLKEDQNNRYLLFGGSLRRIQEFKRLAHTFNYSNSRVVSLPFPPILTDFVWNRLHILPVELFAGKVDVFHSSDWTQPPASAFKVTTIHDLTPLLFPEYSHPRVVETHKRRLNWVKKEADRIIVPSETTRIDCEKLGFLASRLRVIPEAVDPNFVKLDHNKAEKLRRLMGVSGDYLLSIGANKRKNITGILKAFEKIKKLTNLKLVVVGHRFIKATNIESVIFTGAIPQIQLQALYSGASALVYPSFYEGFGLPILEAFKFDVPVITSNVGSMAEIGGKAAVLVDPGNTNSISEGILRALKHSKTFVEKGSKALERYTWRSTASKTLEVYSEANG